MDRLAVAPNINANATQLFGHSSGSLIVNRILIENDDPRIVRAVTAASQLNHLQYRNGNFYICGDGTYAIRKTTALTPREIFSLQGGRDTTIPAAGGMTPKIGPYRKKFHMHSDADSIWAYAVAYGYRGKKLASLNESTYRLSSYLDGRVVSYTVIDATHNNLLENARDIKTAMEVFLARPSMVPAPNSPPPPGSHGQLPVAWRRRDPVTAHQPRQISRHTSNATQRHRTLEIHGYNRDNDTRAV